MRTFVMYRKQDVTGASGCGFVAEGAVFFDEKQAVVKWRTDKGSTVLWDDFKDAHAVHGHDGKTQFLWNDQDWINAKGEPMLCYNVEGVQNFVTGEQHPGWRSEEDARKLGWLRPNEYLIKHVDPKLAEERHVKWRDEVIKMAATCLQEKLHEQGKR